MSNVEYQAEKFTIQLRRPDSATPWGFRLQGGVDFSTPLSVQVVQPNSVSEQCGLKAGDAILTINGVPSDQLTHEHAKQEIVRSGCEIDFLVQRGAVKIWKPQVTPLSELRPAELKTIKTATGEEIQPVQKTSLAINAPQEPCMIGSSHNRSARPFGQKSAVPNVVHAQYNSPIGLYSPDNIASTYSTQTAGIQKEMAGLDLDDAPVGTRVSGTFQQLPEEPAQSALYDESGQALPGFRSVSAPAAKPPGQQKPQQQSMRCGGCDMLATGVIVKANGVPYHVSCFKCESCGMNLKQKGYFVVDGKLFCETHARRKAQPPGADMVAVSVYR
ncbi:PDZ and LIM domain protein 3-like isoform X2 [Pomacea canaliculata]|uniref:PDZ and LIM domain protein 3-like isoform X2 n=1 Tax=Pomacea canaliculata TaxID=400727 RepID=UPI000D740049|nr:PDZ and LIM domain protein 3-like isoform X2 [Pomacea canaliculata]AYH91739.1 PDZ and LIM domain protein 3-like protein isoform X2 [Pomacea canaliculata]